MLGLWRGGCVGLGLMMGVWVWVREVCVSWCAEASDVGWECDRLTVYRIQWRIRHSATSRDYIHSDGGEQYSGGCDDTSDDASESTDDPRDINQVVWYAKV